YTISGFVNGENSGVVVGAPTLSTPATQSSGVGTYPITVSQGTLSAANYDFPAGNLVNGTLTINAAPLTGTVTPAGASPEDHLARRASRAWQPRRSPARSSASRTATR